MRWFCLDPGLPTRAVLRIRAAPNSDADVCGRVAKGKAIAVRAPELALEGQRWLHVAFRDELAGEWTDGFIMASLPDGTRLLVPWERAGFVQCVQVINPRAPVYDDAHAPVGTIDAGEGTQFPYGVLTLAPGPAARVRIFHDVHESVWLDARDCEILCERLQHPKCLTPHAFFTLNVALPPEAQIAIRAFPSKDAETVALLSRGEVLEAAIRSGDWLQVPNPQDPEAPTWIMWQTGTWTLLTEVPHYVSRACVVEHEIHETAELAVAAAAATMQAQAQEQEQEQSANGEGDAAAVAVRSDGAVESKAVEEQEQAQAQAQAQQWPPHQALAQDGDGDSPTRRGDGSVTPAPQSPPIRPPPQHHVIAPDSPPIRVRTQERAFAPESPPIRVRSQAHAFAPDSPPIRPPAQDQPHAFAPQSPPIRASKHDPAAAPQSPPIRAAGSQEHAFASESPPIRARNEDHVFPPPSPPIRVGNADHAFAPQSPPIRVGTRDQVFAPILPGDGDDDIPIAADEQIDISAPHNGEVDCVELHAVSHADIVPSTEADGNNYSGECSEHMDVELDDAKVVTEALVEDQVASPEKSTVYDHDSVPVMPGYGGTEGMAAYEGVELMYGDHDNRSTSTSPTKVEPANEMQDEASINEDNTDGAQAIPAGQAMHDSAIASAPSDSRRNSFSDPVVVNLEYSSVLVPARESSTALSGDYDEEMAQCNAPAVDEPVSDQPLEDVEAIQGVAHQSLTLSIQIDDDTGGNEVDEDSKTDACEGLNMESSSGQETRMNGLEVNDTTSTDDLPQKTDIGAPTEQSTMEINTEESVSPGECEDDDHDDDCVAAGTDFSEERNAADQHVPSTDVVNDVDDVEECDATDDADAYEDWVDYPTHPIVESNVVDVCVDRSDEFCSGGDPDTAPEEVSGDQQIEYLDVEIDEAGPSDAFGSWNGRSGSEDTGDRHTSVGEREHVEASDHDEERTNDSSDELVTSHSDEPARPEPSHIDDNDYMDAELIADDGSADLATLGRRGTHAVSTCEEVAVDLVVSEHTASGATGTKNQPWTRPVGRCLHAVMKRKLASSKSDGHGFRVFQAIASDQDPDTVLEALATDPAGSDGWLKYEGPPDLPTVTPTDSSFLDVLYSRATTESFKTPTKQQPRSSGERPSSPPSGSRNDRLSGIIRRTPTKCQSHTFALIVGDAEPDRILETFSDAHDELDLFGGYKYPDLPSFGASAAFKLGGADPRTMSTDSLPETFSKETSHSQTVFQSPPPNDLKNPLKRPASVIAKTPPVAVARSSSVAASSKLAVPTTTTPPTRLSRTPSSQLAPPSARPLLSKSASFAPRVARPEPSLTNGTTVKQPPPTRIAITKPAASAIPAPQGVNRSQSMIQRQSMLPAPSPSKRGINRAGSFNSSTTTSSVPPQPQASRTSASQRLGLAGIPPPSRRSSFGFSRPSATATAARKAP